MCALFSPTLRRRGWDSNPRYPYEVHTLSRRADSTSSRTSPDNFSCPEFGRRKSVPTVLFGAQWRRERDLNPRGTFWAPNRFRVDRLRPLGHPSLPVKTTILEDDAGGLSDDHHRGFTICFNICRSSPPTSHLVTQRKSLGRLSQVVKPAGRGITRPGGVEPPASSSAGKRSIHLSYGRSNSLAERLGFEPRVDLSGLHALSRRAPSTARPPLLYVGRRGQRISLYGGWRRARDSNPHEPRGSVDFKSTALPIRTSPPCKTFKHLRCPPVAQRWGRCENCWDFDPAI